MSARALTAMRFDLWETTSVGRRMIDDAVWDLGWHGFTCLLAPLRAAGYAEAMTVTGVRVATYTPPSGAPPPTLCTAARIEGWVPLNGRAVPFLICVGKGVAEARKQVVFYDPTGVRHVISLQESGWTAHYRLLHELITQPHPALHLTLVETLTVVSLCTIASRVAVDEGRYPFGTTPDCLRRGIAQGQAA
jgi:hypothetical protein